MCFAAQTPKLRKVAPQKKDTKNTERQRDRVVAASPALKCKQAKLAVRRSALPRHTKDVVRKYPQIVYDDDKTVFFFFTTTKLPLQIPLTTSSSLAPPPLHRQVWATTSSHPTFGAHLAPSYSQHRLLLLHVFLSSVFFLSFFFGVVVVVRFQNLNMWWLMIFSHDQTFVVVVVAFVESTDHWLILLLFSLHFSLLVLDIPKLCSSSSSTSLLIIFSQALHFSYYKLLLHDLDDDADDDEINFMNHFLFKLLLFSTLPK